MELTKVRSARYDDKNPIKEPHIAFESITKKFLASPQSKRIRCTACSSIIDFSSGVAWQGSDTFTCGTCKQLLSMRLIHRALKDLGIVW